MSNVYNATDGPLLIDGAGRIVGAREHRDNVDVDKAPARAHVEAGRLVVMDEPTQTKPGKGARSTEEA